MDALRLILSHIASLYDIVHIWIICWILLLDIHMQMCVPPNIVLILGLILIFLCELLSVSDDTDYS